MAHSLHIVDVFAQQAYAGNPLAVVIVEEELSDNTLQAIAAEMNFSETTFVSPLPESDGGYRVRIFTPASEIAFAGHPLLGTAWVIRSHLVSDEPERVQLNITAGPIQVDFSGDGGDVDTIWFKAPRMTLGRTAERAPVAAALGLEVGDIDAALPIQVISAGTSAMVVPLTGLDALRRSQLDLVKFSSLAAQGFPPLTYLFCRETHDPGNDFCVRFFFDAHGVREDPATGNGAAFFGHYLLEHQLNMHSKQSLRLEQGHQVRRPSLILLNTKIADSEHVIHVGGHVVPTVQGKLLGTV